MISKITLDKKIIPFADGQVIEPKMLNFVFGNNATGKTTISRLIYRAVSEEGLPVSFSDDDEIFVFNRDFVERTFHSFDEFPGVFTLGEDRAEFEETIKDLKEVVKRADKNSETLKTTLKSLSKQEEEVCRRTEEDCWELTAEIRE